MIDTRRDPDDGRAATIAFCVMLLAAAMLRVWLATKGHSIRHPDEIFQTIEQSHRMVFGYGVVPWEYREGIRWIGTPLLLTPPMWLAALLGLGPEFYVPVTRGLLAVLSLAPIPLLFQLVRKHSGGATALLACLLPLFWVEHLDFAGSTLSEALAAPLLGCAALLTLLIDKDSRRWHVAMLAVLLWVTFCMRFHLAPSLLLISIVAWVRMGGALRWSFFVALAVTAAGLEAVDFAFGQVPFQHVVLNLWLNIVEGVSHHYGTEDALYYVRSIWEHWSWGLLLPLGAIVLRWRQTWLLAVAALLIVLAFSAIAHKEYRFYYPATLLFTLAGGWALAEIGARIARRSHALAAVVTVVLLVATVAFETDRYKSVLAQTEDNRIAAQMFAGRQDDICGIGFDIGLVITGTAGLSHFHRDVAFDTIDVTPPEGDAVDRFNYVLVNRDRSGTPPRLYELKQCWGGDCLYRREGSCSPSPPTPDGPGPE